jgi:hypothetical protein
MEPTEIDWDNPSPEYWEKVLANEPKEVQEIVEENPENFPHLSRPLIIPSVIRA